MKLSILVHPAGYRLPVPQTSDASVIRATSAAGRTASSQQSGGGAASGGCC